jgi:hypothetical protein
MLDSGCRGDNMPVMWVKPSALRMTRREVAPPAGRQGQPEAEVRLVWVIPND